MENVADALKLGAAVLIFVMALTISINAFTEARQTSQLILDYKDREYDLPLADRYFEDNGTTERIVKGEAILPAIYKAYTENYKIVFENMGSNFLYEKKDNSYMWQKISYIDLRKEALASVNQRKQFLQGILYGINSFGIQVNSIRKEYENLGIKFTENGIFEQIENSKFIEKLGVYYEQDTYEDSSTPTANYDKKRIITYSKIP